MTPIFKHLQGPSLHWDESSSLLIVSDGGLLTLRGVVVGFDEIDREISLPLTADNLRQIGTLLLAMADRQGGR